jgi:hypothetical protein
VGEDSFRFLQEKEAGIPVVNDRDFVGLQTEDMFRVSSFFSSLISLGYGR